MAMNDKRHWRAAAACAAFLFATVVDAATPAPSCVVLLHGLLRSAGSMAALAAELEGANYVVANVDYPSREHSVQELAPLAVNTGRAACAKAGASPVHFVTHSLGGILLRQYLSQQPLPELGRVVMLGPPNQGSEVVDALAEMPGFAWLNGPAGRQLGTGSDSLPRALGPVNFPVGIIAGDTSINWLLSAIIPGPDDGKVAVEATKVAGMSDFVLVHHSHPLMMRSPTVIDYVLRFLATGRFAAPLMLDHIPDHDAKQPRVDPPR